MHIDLYTKTVLTIIALATSLLALRPLAGAFPGQALAATEAASSELLSATKGIAIEIRTIRQDLRDLSRGYCRNKKLCAN